ncbi:signal sequence receptor alpha chain [Venturia nashicola]|uniref:Signal sequence receptor alpha chain n=1 Tax=Venturia nashicola TaxID=86259 RepID=A0A4Z1NTB7_9PEZI|nr:signal sequence receptor alpha chain [Venturia nashicola]
MAMAVFNLPLWSLLAWRAQAAPEVKVAEQLPQLSLAVTASFPNSDIFGVKLVNRHATQALLSFSNAEPEPVNIRLIGGSLWTLEAPGKPEPYILRNLTTVPYNVEVPAGTNQSLTYNFAQELYPQDLRLVLGAVVDKGENAFQVAIFNSTVTVVEAPLSFFDPQILFIYLLLAAMFAGTLYFIYNTWIKTLFPQTKRRGKGGERARTSTQGKKTAVAPADQVSVIGADGPAVTGFDSSWIPPNHLQRPEPKRIRSGTPKNKPRA